MLELVSNWNTTVSIGVPVLALLLLLNFFFIKRLVKDLDRMQSAIAKLPVQQTKLDNLSEKFSSLESEIKSVGKDLRDFGRVRERVAVLEYAMGITPKRTHDDS